MVLLHERGGSIRITEQAKTARLGKGGLAIGGGGPKRHPKIP